MISRRMIGWGSQDCAIREISAYGEKRAAEIGADKVFNFTIGNPSVEPPDCVHESLERMLKELPPEKLHSYTPAPGLESVRQSMADYLQRSFGVGYRAKDVYMTSGASSALAILAYALLSPGDEMLTFTPCFSEYRLYTEAAGGRLVEVPTDEDSFQLDVGALEKALTPRSAAVLVNSPNNPSGVIFRREKLEQLAELLERKSAEYGHTIYIIADEPYRELVYGDMEVPFIPAIYRNTVYCYSFSKTLSLPGERIGFIALHPDLDDYASVYAAVCGAGRALGYINASSIFQLMVAECIGETVDISRYEYNRDFIYGALTELGFSCVRPDGAFYLFVKAPGGDSRDFCRRAMEHNILLIPGDEFGRGGYARLAYCVTPERLHSSIPAFRALAEEYGLVSKTE
ncbi:MAG: pyridoxal phosphate-dependent aminotransferase [Candidatus Limivicinus sp.]|nr:pyridoxal phosphate-dependent aminotransferase [Candidatus Limivicinus sp.]